MPRPKQHKSCRTCRSCERFEEFDKSVAKLVQSEVTGFCYRYPPAVIAANQSAYPPVKLDGRACDEWKAR